MADHSSYRPLQIRLLQQYLSWCVAVLGTLTANKDGRRKKVDGQTPNFWVYYEVDQEQRIHSLTLATYGQGGTGSWVLLEPAEEGATRYCRV